MKTTTPAARHEAYAAPSTRIIKVNVSGVLMGSFPQSVSQPNELEELGTTSHSEIIWG